MSEGGTLYAFPSKDTIEVTENNFYIMGRDVGAKLDEISLSPTNKFSSKYKLVVCPL